METKKKKKKKSHIKECQLHVLTLIASIAISLIIASPSALTISVVVIAVAAITSIATIAAVVALPIATLSVATVASVAIAGTTLVPIASLVPSSCIIFTKSLHVLKSMANETNRIRHLFVSLLNV